jgi:hypothetical protein
MLAEIHLHPQVKYGCHWADVHEPQTHSTLFTKNSYTEFQENPTRGLAADTTLKTEGRTDGRATFLPSRRNEGVIKI